ncbi:Sodium-dependent phosphate transport protein 1 [Spatholobus suberectus]|nr:Sodium-dependent phosphate transport protein 1 [Spatholobus suberectus]
MVIQIPNLFFPNPNFPIPCDVTHAKKTKRRSGSIPVPVSEPASRPLSSLATATTTLASASSAAKRSPPPSAAPSSWPSYSSFLSGEATGVTRLESLTLFPVTLSENAVLSLFAWSPPLVGQELWQLGFPKRWVIVNICFFAFLLCNMNRALLVASRPKELAPNIVSNDLGVQVANRPQDCRGYSDLPSQIHQYQLRLG